MSSNIYEPENIERRVKEQLKAILPEESYDKWVDSLVFESVDEKKIVIGYYGPEPIRGFKKNYKHILWIHICAVAGYSRKIKICRRKNKVQAVPRNTMTQTAPDSTAVRTDSDNPAVQMNPDSPAVQPGSDNPDKTAAYTTPENAAALAALGSTEAYTVSDSKMPQTAPNSTAAPDSTMAQTNPDNTETYTIPDSKMLQTVPASTAAQTVPGITKIKKGIRAARWFCLSLFFTLFTLAVAVSAGSYILNRSFRETFYSVSSLKANNEIRVIQISDLHKSVYGKNNEGLISRIEKLKPDLILFTGDCVDSAAKSADSTVALCSKLTETAPVYYIYGNNEVEKFYDTPLTLKALDKKYGFSDSDREPSRLLESKDSFEKQLEKNGVKVLKNKADTITVGQTGVDIYGVLTSNPSSFWPYAGKSFSDYIYSNTNNLKITAIHEPFVFENYDDDSWGDLAVCGHTHGGIVRLPVLGPLYTHEGGLLPERNGDYVYGRYDVSGTPLIVSSGLDNSGIFRINNKPELVIIDVNKF